MLKDLLHYDIKREFDIQGEHGIVIWYDPDGTMSGLVEGAVPEGVRLVKFEGSFLALRFELENESPKLVGRWLIYIPEKPLKESWLRDFELMGALLEMDLLSFLQRHYNLSFSPLLNELLRNHPDNSKELVRHWDRIIGDRQITETVIIEALLAIAFEQNSLDFGNALLLFLNEQNWQERLNRRGLWNIWCGKIEKWLDWTEQDIPPEEDALKKKIQAAILLSDLACYDVSLINRFSFLPRDPNKLNELSNLAKQWRNNIAWQQTYMKISEEVEHQYNLKSSISLNEAMLVAETFKAIDILWIEELKQTILPDGGNFGEKVNHLLKIAEKRKGLFWSRCDKALKLFWEGVELVSKIYIFGHEALNKVSQLQHIQDLIKFYVDKKGWYRLDLWTLELATKQSSFLDKDKNRFIQPALTIYRQYLDAEIRVLMNAVKREGWHPTQSNFWKLIPHSKEKVAIFIIDALRFDLAKYLQELVENIVDFKIDTLITMLPSITEIGMAALLSKGEELDLSYENENFLISVQGKKLISKSERKQLLEQYIGRTGKVVDLDELSSVDLNKINILVILSREIDYIGTFTADLNPKGIFDMMDKIVNTIRFVAERDFQKIYIVSDHGFLFAPEGCEPTIMPAPSNALLVKRRFVIGGQSDGCWIAQDEQTGLRGNLLFAFPEGFTIFSLPGKHESFFHGGLSLQECVIPFLIGQVRFARKPRVRMQTPDIISSRILRVTIESQEQDLFFMPRKLKIRVGKHESRLVEISSQTGKEDISMAWLDEFETPPETVIVQLLDAETGEIIDERQIKVQLII